MWLTSTAGRQKKSSSCRIDLCAVVRQIWVIHYKILKNWHREHKGSSKYLFNYRQCFIWEMIPIVPVIRKGEKGMMCSQETERCMSQQYVEVHFKTALETNREVNAKWDKKVIVLLFFFSKVEKIFHISVFENAFNFQKRNMIDIMYLFFQGIV